MSQNSIIARRLSELRENKGVSQQDVADILHVKRATVANYETGNRAPDYETLIKIADYYGVSCDYILRGVRSQFSSINSTTGLDDEAIDRLRYAVTVWRSQNPPTEALDIMNRFISSGSFTDLVAVMTDYCSELSHASNTIESAVITLKDEADHHDSSKPLDVFPVSCFDRELRLYQLEMQELAKGFIQDYAVKTLNKYKEAVNKLNDANKANSETNIRAMAIEKLRNMAGEPNGDNQTAQ